MKKRGKKEKNIDGFGWSRLHDMVKELIPVKKMELPKNLFQYIDKPSNNNQNKEDEK